MKIEYTYITVVPHHPPLPHIPRDCEGSEILFFLCINKITCHFMYPDFVIPRMAMVSFLLDTAAPGVSLGIG